MLVAVGIVVTMVMYTAMAFTLWSPPTLFASADGVNGIAGDQGAAGAAKDAIFTWLHQDIGLFLLPALVLILLAVERLVDHGRPGWIGWTAIVGTPAPGSTSSSSRAEDRCYPHRA